MGIKVASKKIKKESTFKEEKVSSRKKIISFTKNKKFFCIFIFFFFKIFWAKKHKGANQQLSIINGIESESTPKWYLKKYHLFPLLFISFIEINVDIDKE